MRIGELAERTDTPVDTIRYYERAGLLPAPSRTTSNYRSYSAAHAERLRFVRRCRGLDMSLNEIRTLLKFCDEPSRKCGEVNDVLDQHIVDLERRLEELLALACALKQLRAVCRSPGTAASCRILQSLRANTDFAPRRSVRRRLA